MEKYFLVQIKRTNDTIEKGVVVKDTSDAALQSMYAYLGAYAYGGNEHTDYVLVSVMDGNGVRVAGPIVWEKAVEPEPTPEEA